MIHESLKEYQEHHGLADKDFAKKLGISLAYLSLLKSGQRRPGVNMALRIEKITGVPFERLVLRHPRTKIKPLHNKEKKNGNAMSRLRAPGA